MSVGSLLRRLLALARRTVRAIPPEDGPGWVVLRHLGVRANFLVWAQRQGTELAQLWASCPRADWLVGLAARAGVDRRTVADAISDCVGLMPEVGGRQHLDEAIAAAERWVQRRSSLEGLCRPLALAINQALDSDPALVRARIARRIPVGRRFPDEHISADLAERHVLARLAEHVRRRISYDRVREALWGQGPLEAPYR